MKLNGLEQMPTQVMDSSRTAPIIAKMTGWTGGLTVLNIIPEITGAIAAVIGITFTIILGRKRSRNLDMEREERELHIESLKRQIDKTSE